ncbi:unnamed protein product [Mycena citricolor]|uniref:Uncharacterized protein n=1 Tax=Mycena citricolor TaxID=2018698 RepID=A0AAD2K0Y3_9AGAR|nr:unnamed protein product [Mycena citricolor]
MLPFFFHQIPNRQSYLPFVTLFLLLLRPVTALVFAPLNNSSTFLTGESVTLDWTLDGSEPAGGWQLWYHETGVSMEVANVNPGQTSATFPFPGSASGTFQARDGTAIFATSDLASASNPGSASFTLTATRTFSAEITSGATSSASNGVTLSSVFPSSSASVTPSTSSVAAASNSTARTQAILGAIVGTLAVIFIIVMVWVILLIRRRRRHQTLTFNNEDAEKDSSRSTMPSSISLIASSLESPSRSNSTRTIMTASEPSSPPRTSRASTPLPAVPEPEPASADARRQLYLSSQLEKLRTGPTSNETGSITFPPLSAVPSDTVASDVAPHAHGGTSDADQLPAIPARGISPGKRNVFLSQQLGKLDVPRTSRPTSHGASIAFSPLSSVPSESAASENEPQSGATVRRTSTVTSSELASPILFRRPTVDEVVRSLPALPRAAGPSW